MTTDSLIDRKNDFNEINVRLGWTSDNVIKMAQGKFKDLADLPLLVFGDAMNDEAALEKSYQEKNAISLRDRFNAHARLVSLYDTAHYLADLAGTVLLTSDVVPKNDLLPEDAIAVARQLRIVRDNAEHRRKEHHQLIRSYGNVMLANKIITDEDYAIELQRAKQGDPLSANLTTLSAIHAQMLINQDDLLKAQHALIAKQTDAANLSIAYTVARKDTLELPESDDDFGKRIFTAGKLVEAATSQYLVAIEDLDRFSKPVIPPQYRPG